MTPDPEAGSAPGWPLVLYFHHVHPVIDHYTNVRPDQFARGLDRSKADTFVGMYVNDWTLDYGERGRRAVQLFLERGVAAGVINQPVKVEFVD